MQLWVNFLSKMFLIDRGPYNAKHTFSDEIEINIVINKEQYTKLIFIYL